MRFLPILMRVSAIALPIAMALALAVRHTVEQPVGFRWVGVVILFAQTCWLARFQWRRSLDQEAVFFNARVLPTDPETTRLSVDVGSLAVGVLEVAAVLLNML